MGLAALLPDGAWLPRALIRAGSVTSAHGSPSSLRSWVRLPVVKLSLPPKEYKQVAPILDVGSPN